MYENPQCFFERGGSQVLRLEVFLGLSYQQHSQLVRGRSHQRWDILGLNKTGLRSSRKVAFKLGASCWVPFGRKLILRTFVNLVVPLTRWIFRSFWIQKNYIDILKSYYLNISWSLEARNLYSQIYKLRLNTFPGSLTSWRMFIRSAPGCGKNRFFFSLFKARRRNLFLSLTAKVKKPQKKLDGPIHSSSLDTNAREKETGL